MVVTVEEDDNGRARCDAGATEDRLHARRTKHKVDLPQGLELCPQIWIGLVLAHYHHRLFSFKTSRPERPHERHQS